MVLSTVVLLTAVAVVPIVAVSVIIVLFIFIFVIIIIHYYSVIIYLLYLQDQSGTMMQSVFDLIEEFECDLCNVRFPRLYTLQRHKLSKQHQLREARMQVIYYRGGFSISAEGADNLERQFVSKRAPT